LHTPVAQHPGLSVLQAASWVFPSQLQPSSGLPEQLNHGPKQWFTHVPLSQVELEKHVEHATPHPPQ
jgi:hypothetical protein